MSGSTYPHQTPLGFLTICEGPMLGAVVGWWLQIHLQPPPVFIAAGVMSTALYLLLLKAGRDSALGAAVIIVSMVLWGMIGWHLGGFLCRSFAMRGIGSMLFDTVTAWKVGAALLFTFVAYNDKASMVSDGGH